MWLGATLFSLASLLLGTVAFIGLRRIWLSSVAFGALALYALIAAANVSPLSEEFGHDVYLHAALIFASGSVILCLSLLIFASASAGETPPPVWDRAILVRHTQLCMWLGLLSLGLLAFFREDIAANWVEARQTEGPGTVLGTFLLMLACPGVVSAFRSRKWSAAILILMVCTAAFLLLGSRAAILGSAALVLWLSLTSASTTGRRLWTLLMIGLVGIALHVVLRQLRGLGVTGLLQALADGDLLAAVLGGGNNQTDLSGGEAAIPKYLLFATTVQSAPDFGFMTSMERVATLFIPHMDGIGKPMDVTYLLWARAFVDGLFTDYQGQQLLLESYMSGTLGSLHATLFGEYFVSGGWVSLVASSVLLGGLFAVIEWIMRKVDRLTSLALCGPVLIGYVFVARGNSVIGLGYFFYLLIIVTAIRYALMATLGSPKRGNVSLSGP